MFMFALGRELVDSDECATREVLAKMRREGYRFSALVLGVVESIPFQYQSGLEFDSKDRSKS